MREEKSFWIPVNLESEETEQQIRQAMDECESIRHWAFREMQLRWDATSGSAKSSDVLPALTAFARASHFTVQHYSMVVALNQAVADFNERIRSDNSGIGGQVVMVQMPQPQWPSPYAYELTVQSRAVWARYMANYGRISTAYGMVYMEGEWEETLKKQAERLGVYERMIPYLWYSATLKVEAGLWMAHFNIHRPDSSFGRKKKREGEKRDARKVV